MAHCNTVMAVVRECSYGKIVLDHLAADGAGFTGGQVTVVAVCQVDANFLSSLHLELLHSLLCLGNIDLIVLPTRFLLFFTPVTDRGLFIRGLCSELFLAVFPPQR